MNDEYLRRLCWARAVVAVGDRQFGQLGPGFKHERAQGRELDAAAAQGERF
jgi:hypothetical protein